MFTHVLELDPETSRTFDRLCRDKGIEPERLMAVMVASFASKKTVYGLEDKLRFGKYSGFTLEELIRSDSKYVWWLVNVSDTFDVDQFAFELLMELDPPKRGHSL